ncbi:MAG: hypothetical protein GX786_08140 [Clostridiales bacterium]|nr:hypothetical protein [Clostridiales bacterium]
MKKILSCFIVMVIVLSLPLFAFAEISGDPAKEYKTPFMITNAGQGPGGKMGRLLINQAKVLEENTDFYYVDVPYAEDLEEHPYTCMIIVIGSTDKGLGATGITIDQEIERLDGLVARAQEMELPIIAVLLEKDKRSDIPTNANERCIDAVCPYSDWMIVVAEGNTDGRFDNLKKEHDIPLTVLDNSMDFIELSKVAFIKE